jgi:uncharacterized protein (TIGR02246 family)
MKKYLLVVLLLSAVLVAAVACGSTDSEEEVAAAVDEIFDEYVASVTARDADRWIALWTDDPVQLPPDAPTVTDWDTLYENTKAEFEVFAFTGFEINVEEVQVAGEWAYARGHYTVTIEMIDGGDIIPIDGKFLTIFQQQSDGSWKIHRDAFNSNVP